jgi:hypothetical protein
MVAGAVVAVAGAAITAVHVGLADSNSHRVPAAVHTAAATTTAPVAKKTSASSEQTAALAVQRLAATSAGRHICYRAYVSDTGWQEPVCDGVMAGAVGQGRAVQALNIAVSGVSGTSANGNIQKSGWEKTWKDASDGDDLYIGTAGKALPMVGFGISVGSGAVCQNAHVLDRGWLGLACDTPGSYVYGGTLDNTRWLEAIRLTV